MITTIDELKQNLNIESTYKDEDAYLLNLLDVSESVVFNYIDKEISDFTTAIPAQIKQAIIMLASFYYENRTPVSFGQAYKLPFSFELLLFKFRNITIA